MRNSLREHQVHDHDHLDFFEPQRGLTPGRDDKGSTSFPRDRSCGSWPPLALTILGNQSQLLPDQAVCKEAPPLPVSPLSAPCSPHWAGKGNKEHPCAGHGTGTRADANPGSTCSRRTCRNQTLIELLPRKSSRSGDDKLHVLHRLFPLKEVNK